MEGIGFPPELPWWGATGNSSWPGVPEEAFGGRLGSPSVLRHGMRGEERAHKADDRPREVWAGSLLGDPDVPPSVRPKKYNLLPDHLLQDPFDSRE